jgi:DEAD/DEAH box helicase domain-containing protein
MKFAELYRNNREAVSRALTHLWCGAAANESQSAYHAQLKTIIGDIFASQKAMPLVQCMNAYEPVKSASVEAAKALVGGLWKAGYAPYEHQYKCWKTLLADKTADGRPKSICVTTGTGSGKTECFMLPLVKDLRDLNAAAHKDQVQAIFLYPLNALMEDQKERLEKALEGTNLTYSVYNGDLPERAPRDTDDPETAQQIQSRIDAVRGVREDGTVKFPKMICTREQLRKTPPNILLTNPTMLEYILLRGSDGVLTNPAEKSLRWVVIDETHSYTGAGAAELAMLLRRVLIAFGVSARDVRFATSSATLGNAGDPKKAAEDREKLRTFICGITGASQEAGQVEIVEGRRVGADLLAGNPDQAKWQELFKKDFMSLDELCKGGATIEDKLAALDEMCARVEPKNEKGLPSAKAKLHLFYRVPNNGLFVRLDEHAHGAFAVKTENAGPAAAGAAGATPTLELCRCRHCGEYLALAKWHDGGAHAGEYEAPVMDDSDMFDLEGEDAGKGDLKDIVFGLTKDALTGTDGNAFFAVKGNRVETVTEPGADWHVVGNMHRRCPYCAARLTGKARGEGEDLGELNVGKKLAKFRVSADYVGRLIAPTILDQMEEVKPAEGGNILLHRGQQYLSFADSRQGAARASLKVDLEQEKLWVYAAIYRELNRRAAANAEVLGEIKKWEDKKATADADFLPLIEKKIGELRAKARTCMTWEEVGELLLNDPLCKVFAPLFIRQAQGNDELDEKGEVKEITYRKYVYSVMVDTLVGRPLTAASPENLGLFQACYPQLETKVTALPAAVEAFNASLKGEGNRISLQDWRDLLRVYLDYSVRSNQSVFLRMTEKDGFDIFSCARFASHKPPRRPARKPKTGESLSESRIVRYLCRLVCDDQGHDDLKTAYAGSRDAIAGVVDALWTELIKKGNGLLEWSTHWDEDAGKHVKDNPPRRDGEVDPYRLNLANLSFELVADAALCDVSDDAVRGGKRRPVGSAFKGMSPYLKNGEVVFLDETKRESWAAYPHYRADGGRTDAAVVAEWAKANRKLLWDNGLWGEDGEFADKLTAIHRFPDLFVQQEHTAQVDKIFARRRQEAFKRHEVNILACSTTMEMGVDLGDLEAVVLNSVPPQPANYKQRAGRSGRNNKVRSVCLTLCGSDSIGLRTYLRPLETIINRPVMMPTVDLLSRQVVQRHANAFLIRAFGVFATGEKGGSLGQRVADFYTPFQVKPQHGEQGTLAVQKDGEQRYPDARLGDPAGTKFAEFNERCSKVLDAKTESELKALLANTCFDGKMVEVLEQAKAENCRCYAELEDLVSGYGDKYAEVKGDEKTSEKFRNRLKMQYFEALANRLLSYWATNRFTPNANMPVNVIPFDLNTTGGVKSYKMTTASNPSYQLREALGQYAPGNTVVVDGVCYTVRGVDLRNQYQSSKTFKKIYRNADRVVVEDATSLADKMKWGVSGRMDVELARPVSFLPDRNEETNRLLQPSPFTHVNAQLIGTTDWSDKVTEPHLFSVRCNRDTGDAKILYYNEGVGFGYCLCLWCGRAVVEQQAADAANSLNELPPEMNPKMTTEEDPSLRKRYHFNITSDKTKRCLGAWVGGSVRRNVVLGDFIQTDFCEIRIRRKGESKWHGNRAADERLLYTLGVVLTRALLECLGKDSGAVGFSVMPNGHLCLFDTNPGGAGYSNQLADTAVMCEVLKRAKTILESAKGSVDELLDRATLRFAKYMDVPAALAWIAEEEASCVVCDEAVIAILPTAVQTSMAGMLAAFSSATGERVLFFGDDYGTWDSDEWLTWFKDKLLKGFVSLCVAKTGAGTMPEPALEMLRGVNGVTDKIVAGANEHGSHDIYPIAYAGGHLYFVTERGKAQWNKAWGNATLYQAKAALEDFVSGTVKVDLAYSANTVVFKLNDSDPAAIVSTELGQILETRANAVVGAFLNHCSTCADDLKVEYCDKHLKTTFGIVETFQVVEHFVKKIDKPFSLSFKILDFADGHPNKSIFSNLPNAVAVEEMIGKIGGQRNEIKLVPGKGSVSEKPKCNGVSVEKKKAYEFEHWRELRFACGGKTLSIYPDGGFANGWNLDTDYYHAEHKHFDHEKVRYDTAIHIKRDKDIKFDVCLS